MNNAPMACPYCGGTIQPGIAKCRHCGEWLQQPPASPSSSGTTGTAKGLAAGIGAGIGYGCGAPLAGCFIILLVIAFFAVVSSMFQIAANRRDIARGTPAPVVYGTPSP